MKEEEKKNREEGIAEDVAEGQTTVAKLKDKFNMLVTKSNEFVCETERL